MRSHMLDSLVQFCAEQLQAFDPDAWRRTETLDRKALAIAAKYLSMTSWYGHDFALESLAEELRPGMSLTWNFERESASSGFDLAYFSAALRYRIAIESRSASQRAAR